MTYQAKHCKDCFERLSLEEQKVNETLCARCRFRQQVMARQIEKAKTNGGQH